MKQRWILHILLLVVTIYTTTIAGAMFEKYGFTIPSLVYLVLHPSLLSVGLPFSLWLIFILGSHEMGHYIACRKYHVPATLPFFIPAPTIFGTAGAVIKIKGVITDRKALFDIGAAGPIASFLASIPPLLIGIQTASLSTAPIPEGTLIFEDSLLISIMSYFYFSKMGYEIMLNVNSVFYAGWAGLLATTMNLFPVGQLDGGHICYALSRKFHRALSYVTILGMIGLVFFSILMRGFSVWILWLAVLILMGGRHPRLLDEDQKLPGGRKWLSLILLIIMILSFMIDPISIG
jgi:membrane-associated protease RseP (regulator of RpoE activity)